MNPAVRNYSKDLGLALAAALMLALAIPAESASFGADPGFSPRVPVSALGTPAWFDASRLHVSSMLSVGSGFGTGVNALQVTSLSYQFGAPLAMSVNIGNAWGTGLARTNSSFFLEGLDLNYRPNPNLQFMIHYQNVRSPLQLSPNSEFWPFPR